MLRTKLSQTEFDLARSKEELKRHENTQENSSLQDDIDRIALQREVADLKRRLSEFKERNSSLEGRVKGLMDVHEEAIRAVEELNSQLKDEKRRNIDLESQLRQLELMKKSEKDLMNIIDDLRSEKRLLEGELQKLIAASLRKPEVIDYDDDEDEEVRELKDEIKNMAALIESLEKQLKAMLGEKKDAVDRLDRTLGKYPYPKDHNILSKLTLVFTGDLADVQSKYAKLLAEFAAVKASYDDISEQLRYIKDGPIPWSEIEQALAFIRSRKERGKGLDTLIDLEELEEHKKLLEELRVNYAEAVQELNKMRKMLELQMEINKEYKAENDDLRKKLEAMRNEYGTVTLSLKFASFLVLTRPIQS